MEPAVPVSPSMCIDMAVMYWISGAPQLGFRVHMHYFQPLTGLPVFHVGVQ